MLHLNLHAPMHLIRSVFHAPSRVCSTALHDELRSQYCLGRCESGTLG